MIANCPNCWKLFNRSPERRLCEACHWKNHFSGTQPIARSTKQAMDPRLAKKGGTRRTHLANPRSF